MNIGIVTAWFHSGGGVVGRSYEGILQETHRVFIYARGPGVSAEPVWNRSNVTRGPYHPVATGIHPGHFARWAKRHMLDAVLFNEQHHWSGVITAKRLGLLTGGYVDYYTQATVPFFNLYDFLICNTRRHHSVFQHHPQCCYCPWGTETSIYRPTGQRAEGPPRFLISAGWDGHYARQTPHMDRRGAGLSMRAFREVRGDCRLIVLSQDPLERCPKEWQESITKDPRIEFRVGTFDPTPYGDGDVYLYPSRLDGIGLTLPEALSCGLPAITTDAPPMSEFVRDGVNGRLVKVVEYRGRPDGYYWAESLCDESELVKACQFYVDHPDQMRAHGARAREIAERDLDWRRNAAFLSKWIASQMRLGGDEDPAWRETAARATRYDHDHSPTPVRRLRGATAAVLKQVLGMVQ
jgi:glycosyltransferase involved in cell wall biosynthesis